MYLQLTKGETKEQHAYAREEALRTYGEEVLEDDDEEYEDEGSEAECGSENMEDMDSFFAEEDEEEPESVDVLR